MRILLYDLETFPNIGYFWPGKMYEVNIIEVIKYGGIASVSWKWLGESAIHSLSREGKKNDKSVVKKLWELFNDADITIAHNGISFDSKTSNNGIAQYGLGPPSPYKQIDTKVEVKKHFRFDSNSLDAVAQFLGVGRKLKHQGFDMWKECMADDSRAWKEMIRYNKHDVYLLEGVYNKIKGWIKHPLNLAFIDGKPEACTTCTGNNIHSRGYNYTRVNKFKKYQCQDCKSWMVSRVAEVVKKPTRSAL